MHSHRFLVLCVLAVALASCGKKETATSNSATALDTTKPAQSVPISDTNHHLFFRPPVGSVEHYHVMEKMTMGSSDTPPSGTPESHSGSSTSEFFIRQTVKSIGRDSSVTLEYRVDSIRVNSKRDTTQLHYSSNDLRDRMNEQFSDFNIVIGKDVTVRANKYGDLDTMLDVSQVAAGLLSTVPDSVRNKPQIREMATRQAENVVNAYIMRVLVHNPTKALVTDTTWRDSSDVNLDVAPGLSFPVHIDASETVRGLEKQDGRVFAVLEDNTTTTPRKRTFQEGPTTATIQDFVATSHSVVHIEDTTGMLYLRSMREKRNFTLVIESKQQPGQERKLTQSGTEELTTEILQ